jgi:tetratricopeptide (TPR) repeat protein
MLPDYPPVHPDSAIQKEPTAMIRSRLVCLIIAILSAGAPQRAPADETAGPKQALEAINDLNSQGRYDEAISFAESLQKYLSALTFDESNDRYIDSSRQQWYPASFQNYNWVSSYLALARAYTGKKSYDTAVTKLSYALVYAERLDPSFLNTADTIKSIKLSWCDTLFTQGKYEEALTRAKNWISSDDRGSLMAIAGASLVRLKKPAEALPYLDKGIAKNPSLTEAFRYRAEANGVLGNTLSAISDISAVIKAIPGDMNALRVRAALYIGAGSYDKAADDISALLLKAPTDGNLRFSRAQIYLQALNKPVLAADDLTVIIAGSGPVPNGPLASGSDHQKYFLWRGIAYAFAGRYHEAIADLDKVCGDLKDNSTVVAYYNRGVCNEKVAQPEAATADYRTVCALDPTGVLPEGKKAALRLKELGKPQKQ